MSNEKSWNETFNIDNVPTEHKEQFARIVEMLDKTRNHVIECGAAIIVKHLYEMIRDKRLLNTQSAVSLTHKSLHYMITNFEMKESE